MKIATTSEIIVSIANNFPILYYLLSFETAANKNKKPIIPATEKQAASLSG